jgi:hypothetical protein
LISASMSKGRRNSGVRVTVLPRTVRYYQIEHTALFFSRLLCEQPVNSRRHLSSESCAARPFTIRWQARAAYDPSCSTHRRSLQAIDALAQSISAQSPGPQGFVRLLGGVQIQHPHRHRKRNPPLYRRRHTPLMSLKPAPWPPRSVAQKGVRASTDRAFRKDSEKIPE